MRVVLDTNVLIDAIPEWSRHRVVLDALLDDRYDAVVNIRGWGIVHGLAVLLQTVWEYSPLKASFTVLP